MSTLNVACVLNSQDSNHGVKYSADWVDRLYAGVKRNLDIEFEFVCLTNESVNCNTIPFALESDGYWNKIELFRRGLFSGPTLYLDLDVVVCKNITNDILRLPQDQLLMTQEPYRNIHNSSIMFWNRDYSFLFDAYAENQCSIVNEYQFNLGRTGCLGDQAYIGENIDHGLIEDYVGDGFVGWRHHKIATEIKDPGLLVFTGKEKPSNNANLDLVKMHWRT